MDKSKLISHKEFAPSVNFANYSSPKPASVWGPRVIPDIELILIVNGEFEYEDENGLREYYNKADLCIISPGIEHTFRNVQTLNTKTPFFSCIHLEFMAGKSYLSGDYQLDLDLPLKTRAAKFDELAELFRFVAKHFVSDDICSAELACAAAKMILLYCFQQWHTRSSQPISNILEDMTAFLRERFMDSVSREDLSRKFGISPQYVNRLFRKELGVTPTEYLNKYRVEVASDYLSHKGMKVSDVGPLVGFDDPFYFSRVFKKYAGCSPSEKIRASLI